MHFINNQSKIKNKKNVKLKVSSNYSINIINEFLKKYPELASGRKNYISKEIEIANPISTDLNVLRRSIFSNLIIYLKKNQLQSR